MRQPCCAHVPASPVSRFVLPGKEAGDWELVEFLALVSGFGGIAGLRRREEEVWFGSHGVVPASAGCCGGGVADA